ncbi:hypothetical protein JCM9492_01240 [Aquifex pyrophilus]
MSAKDTVRSMVIEFAKNINETEPFNTKLTEFKLKLKSTITMLLFQIPDQEVKQEQFKDVVEGINEAIVEISKEIKYDNEKLLERYALFFETLNGVLKEYLEREDLNDKHELSQLSSKISKILERIRLELKEKKGGILKLIKRMIFRS